MLGRRVPLDVARPHRARCRCSAPLCVKLGDGVSALERVASGQRLAEGPDEALVVLGREAPVVGRDSSDRCPNAAIAFGSCKDRVVRVRRLARCVYVLGRTSAFGRPELAEQHPEGAAPCPRRVGRTLGRRRFRPRRRLGHCSRHCARGRLLNCGICPGSARLIELAPEAARGACGHARLRAHAPRGGVALVALSGLCQPGHRAR
mmetsp:Transcript_28599/g.86412  ORF Transcript_28599/g.86412 Transcript_28599/m.86412 type:complete len:205 (+) Transcript_28599:169-783(+)